MFGTKTGAMSLCDHCGKPANFKVYEVTVLLPDGRWGYERFRSCGLRHMMLQAVRIYNRSLAVRREQMAWRVTA